MPPAGAALQVLAGNVEAEAPWVSAPPLLAYSTALLLTLNKLLPIDVCTSNNPSPIIGLEALLRTVNPLEVAVLLSTISAPPALLRVLSYAACSVVELDAPAAVQSLPFHTIVAVVLARMAIKLPTPPPFTDSEKSFELP